MTSQLGALTFDAHDPRGLATFWSGIFGWDVADDPHEGFTLVPNDDTGFRLRFVASDEKRRGPNQMHFDITSTTPEVQQQTVARALELGGAHLDIGQGADAKHVVMSDPEGNELCVIPAGNRFLAECGFLGAVSSDGTQAVGYFWSEALGWPLVWDQDEETAIRSPQGGPKITWGGPPVAQKLGKNRLHFDLVADGDLEAEADRLISLGASRLDIGQGEAGWVVMADPDGNEFCLMPPR
ncbi:VOC family protein [Nonomuraea sp. NBC_01738]|uniref:VOC family protein n=1 Tax=Nonomuraea sp. NBC_01738 TaxID=2976003 RepID=UPI002E14A250|nr:VOC family protein [Nonomuraea sp. NBC_01738]